MTIYEYLVLNRGHLKQTSGRKTRRTNHCKYVGRNVKTNVRDGEGLSLLIIVDQDIFKTRWRREKLRAPWTLTVKLRRMGAFRTKTRLYKEHQSK